MEKNNLFSNYVNMFKNWIKKLKKNIEILNHNISILLNNKNNSYVTLLYHRILPYHSKINIGNEITIRGI